MAATSNFDLFTRDLWNTFPYTGGSFGFSPLLIQACLAALLPDLDEKSANEILNAVRPQSALRKGFLCLCMSLKNNIEQLECAKLIMKNLILYKSQYPMIEKKNEWNLADCKRVGENLRVQIHEWLQQCFRNFHPDLEQLLRLDTEIDNDQMVMLSAFHFLPEFIEPFDPRSLVQGIFNGTRVWKVMRKMDNNYMFEHRLRCHVMQFTLKSTGTKEAYGNKMMIFYPGRNRPIDDVIQKLYPAEGVPEKGLTLGEISWKLQHAKDNAKTRLRARFSMPLFMLRTSFPNLKETIRTTGIERIFGNNLDENFGFHDLFDGKPCHRCTVDNIHQETYFNFAPTSEVPNEFWRNWTLFSGLSCSEVFNTTRALVSAKIVDVDVCSEFFVVVMSNEAIVYNAVIRDADGMEKGNVKPKIRDPLSDAVSGTKKGVPVPNWVTDKQKDEASDAAELWTCKNECCVPREWVEPASDDDENFEQTLNESFEAELDTSIDVASNVIALPQRANIRLGDAIDEEESESDEISDESDDEEETEDIADIQPNDNDEPLPVFEIGVWQGSENEQPPWVQVQDRNVLHDVVEEEENTAPSQAGGNNDEEDRTGGIDEHRESSQQ